MTMKKTKQDWITELRKPLKEASTLPPICYTSAEFFDREINDIFLKNWQFVGRVESVEQRGQYFCYDGLGGSVIVIRTDDNEIQAYANTCRHRGSRLLSGQGQCARIVCPYHSWVYQLDGALIGALQMEDVTGFQKKDFSLLEISLKTWGGFIFINYDCSPASFEAHLGNFPDMFIQHKTAEMRVVHTLKFEVSSNWKLLAENALEAYHTGTVHRDTLGQQASSPLETSANWTGLLVNDETSVATFPGEEKPFSHIEGLNETAQSGAFFTLLFPSTQFVFVQDCMWWFGIEPVAVDRTHLTLGACFPKSTIARTDFEDKLAVYVNRWQLATAEDNAICESQQQGQIFNRPAGRFAPDEFAVHAFSNWIVNQLFD
jgi:choline monooxygenase